MVRTVFRMYRRAYDGLPIEIWWLSGALFINRFGTMVLPFFTLYLTSQLDYSDAAASRMLSIYGLGSICGAYLGGRLTSRVGAIRLQVISLFCAVPACLAVPLFRSWVGIAASIFLMSLFSEAVRPANGTALTHFTPPALRVRAFGLQRMAVNLGISFGPAIGGALAMFSFVWLFIVDAGTTFLCALALVALFGFRRYAKVDDAERPGVQSGSTPLKDTPFVLFLSLILLTSIVFFQFHVTYPLYLSSHYHLSKAAIGLIYAINTVVIVVFEMLLLNYVRRFPMMLVIGCGSLLSCLGFGMLPFGSSVIYCIASMLVITLGEMLWMPLASGWVAHRSDRGDRGLYMGWYSMTFSVSFVIAPIVGGALYARDHRLIWIFGNVIGVITFLSLAGLHFLVDREKEPNGVEKTEG